MFKIHTVHFLDTTYTNQYSENNFHGSYVNHDVMCMRARRHSTVAQPATGVDTLAIISSRYQYGTFLFFVAEVTWLLMGWKHFLYFRRPSWGLRPVAFATSATWWIRHCRPTNITGRWNLYSLYNFLYLNSFRYYSMAWRLRRGL